MPQRSKLLSPNSAHRCPAQQLLIIMDAATLPPYGHMYMVGLWIETLLYGRHALLEFAQTILLMDKQE